MCKFGGMVGEGVFPCRFSRLFVVGGLVVAWMYCDRLRAWL